MKHQLTIALLLLIGFSGCLETQSSKGQEPPIDAPPSASPVNRNQVISLTGHVLPPKEFPDRLLEQREEQLKNAQNKYEKDPDSLENIIWYGRRLGYIGRYQDAIRIFSVGLDLYPNSYKLLRHRGHRYITTRQFDKAIEDLQRAAFYARPVVNAMEPDGLPNRLNKPISNNKFNIWYHLGIAYYLKGNYDKALSSFKQCQDYADNDDLKVAVADWSYMTYRKLGNQIGAKEAIAPIGRRMDIIENYSYHQRILMYKGQYEAESLLQNAEGSNNSIHPTLGYGIACYYLNEGQVDKAREIYQLILKNDQWDAFGYIASEADVLSISKL
ncbi:MAG: tetratricopeptide repeat protein [Marinoscillum sp.]